MFWHQKDLAQKCLSQSEHTQKESRIKMILFFFFLPLPGPSVHGLGKSINNTHKFGVGGGVVEVLAWVTQPGKTTTGETFQVSYFFILGWGTSFFVNEGAILRSMCFCVFLDKRSMSLLVQWCVWSDLCPRQCWFWYAGAWNGGTGRSNIWGPGAFWKQRGFQVIWPGWHCLVSSRTVLSQTNQLGASWKVQFGLFGSVWSGFGRGKCPNWMHPVLWVKYDFWVFFCQVLFRKCKIAQKDQFDQGFVFGNWGGLVGASFFYDFQNFYSFWVTKVGVQMRYFLTGVQIELLTPIWNEPFVVGVDRCSKPCEMLGKIENIVISLCVLSCKGPVCESFFVSTATQVGILSLQYSFSNRKINPDKPQNLPEEIRVIQKFWFYCEKVKSLVLMPCIHQVCFVHMGRVSLMRTFVSHCVNFTLFPAEAVRGPRAGSTNKAHVTLGRLHGPHLAQLNTVSTFRI